MQYKNLTLDKFQEDAIAAIENNHSVVVSAPTGSGKTLIADYIIEKYLKKGITVIYTAPIKALSNQKFKDFTKDYGRDNIGLITGDVVINPKAPILIMTTEVYRNMALTDDPAISAVSYVVFDEIHYINDVERGYVWEESIIFSKNHVRFLCLSATIPNSREFADWIQAIKEHKVEVVTHDKRSVPLDCKFYDQELGVSTLEDTKKQIDDQAYKYRMGWTRFRGPKPKLNLHISLIKEIKHQLPCFFFTFSRHRCQENAVALARQNLFEVNPKIAAYTREKLSDAPKEINSLKSTRQLRQTLPQGIAFHHAGLIPVIKELVEDLFSQGLINVLYTTETFAVGINMPAKTVCFDSLMKYDGINFRYLNSKEYFQIAGRAGRRGIDKKGFSYAIIERRDFNHEKIKKITTKDTEPIMSQFRLSVNTVLNLIKQHTNKEIDSILCMNFNTFQKYGKTFRTEKKDEIYSTFNNIKKKLIKRGYVKDDKLTEKGNFASRIYADEILTGELFATEFYKDLNDFQVFMLIACICFEPRSKTEFYSKYPSKDLNILRKKIQADSYLQGDARFKQIKNLTALVAPCYRGDSIFEILKNTSLLEGDIIRFFRQLLDRIGQIKKAAKDDKLLNLVGSCEHKIMNSLEEIDAI